MLVFVDLKLSGFESGDTLCYIGVLHEDGVLQEFINEGKKIKSEASASHHITNDAIKDAPKFLESQSFALLEQLDKDDLMVVHDYVQTQRVFEQYGLQVYADIIDTKRISKHLMEDLSRYDLNYLRYELQLGGIKDACYDARNDIFVVRALFEELQESYDVERMQQLSFEPVLLQKMSFGKYEGRYIEEILQIDPRYLEWVLGLDGLDEDLQYSIRHYFER